MHTALPYTIQETNSERTRTIRETNERAVKIKKGFGQGRSEDKRESRTECGVSVRNECRWGVQKNVRERTKERMEVNVEIL
jgi:hypothetical protein